jgi:hypothetical protein
VDSNRAAPGTRERDRKKCARCTSNDRTIGFHGDSLVTMMKKVIAIFVIVLSFSSQTRAQDSTRLERYGYVIGASLAFSLLDYVGFNLDLYKHNNNSLFVYHSIESLTGAAITYFLYKTCGLSSALSFDLIWWTWGDDLGFYGYQDAFNIASWRNRTAHNDLKNNQITWAGWTPIGLLRPQGSVIARSALYGQVAIGFSIAMGALW